MTYGHFDDANKEYVITNPKTPVKWVNYVGTLDFGGLVDHTGGSLLCAGDPATNRIVKYIPQLPSSDFKGQTLYIKATIDGVTRTFSPFFVPTLDPYEFYECRVGLGYQRIRSRFYGIECDVTIFIPDGGSVEVRDIVVRNMSGSSASIEVIPVVEFTHFDALKQFTNADWVPQTMRCDAETSDDGMLLIRQYAFMHRDAQHSFVSSNHPVASFETDRKTFLGHNEYGTWKDPEALKAPALSNTEARRGDTIAALRHNLGELENGAEQRIIFQIGHGKPNEVSSMAEQFRDPANVDEAFQKLTAFWDDYLGAMQCESPDASFQTMVNIHNPRQCFMTLNWSRYLSLYQLGLGARGMGFRDTSQDILGAIASAPGKSLDLLRKLLSVQKADGSAMHQFNPLSMEANEGDSREEGEKQTYGDDHLWVILAVCAYLKETGDPSFLQEEISFYDKQRELPERERGTVLDHLLRGLNYTKTNTGQNGLPLMGFADWNDTVNLPGEAESCMVACLYGRALIEMIELMEFLGSRETADALRADHAEMNTTFNEAAWDGDWYIRYFKEDGTPLGSKTNETGSIFTNGQSWPVLAGFAPADRAETALQSVYDHLNTSNGIKLSGPGFDGYDEAIGGVSSYPPGAKENGGIFLHSNPWVMIAETIMGNGDRAYQYYQQINPAAKNDHIDQYECEPYCYAQNILGDEHEQFGLGRNSWLSGTASWTYQVATQWILGVRPTHKGLLIAPCLPSGWDQVKVTRRFRGAFYHITIKNGSGPVSIKMNGETIEGCVVPICPAGSTQEIEINMTSKQAVAV